MQDATAATHDPAPALDAVDSPADSPATPVNDATNVALKLADLSDTVTRIHPEPISIRIDKVDNASTFPQVGTPLDPDSIPITAPHGTPPPPTGELLDDVKMAEEESHVVADDVEMKDEVAEPAAESLPEPAVNGAHEDAMDYADSAEPPATPPADTPVSQPGGSSTTAVDSASPNDDDAPPAKRARKFSDADQASAHQAVAHPAPTRASGVDTERSSTFSVAQHKFAVSTIRTLKKLKDSQPFKTPVDPVTLNIPHYTTVITHPMDFSTVERKLAATNPIKPDLNADVPSYLSADEFIADVRLIFSNCVTFNGPEHVVTLQGKRVEAVFDKQIKQLPPPEEPKPLPVKKLATPPPPPPPAVPKKAPRRPSTTVPVIRRNDNDSVGRPKREIHPPPPKDLPYSDAPKKQRKRAAKNDRTNEQLRFCLKVLDHLNRKQHAHVVEAFLAPVDWQLLNIPDYPRIIKKPMDLGTMRKKLENGDYVNAQRFHDDFQLMIRNCYTYNAAGTLVHGFAVEVEKLFNEKWKDLPPLHPTPVSDDDDDEDEDDSEDERRHRIAAMEAEIRNMENNIAMLKGDTVKKRPKPTKKNTKKPRDMEVYSPPVASSSKASKKDNKSATKKKPGKKQPVPDDDALSFEQKKDLSEAISALDVTKLERVIQIIHEGVPEIRDSQEEIELEIDTLPSAVLTKLYNFVIRPLRQPPAKRSRPGKGTGTGGLKRKSMDENQEAEKIRALEERMKLFDQPDGHAAPLAATNGHDSEHSSDESSDDDSSESE